MLSDLPFEILTDIAIHLPTASSLRALSLTCQRLHDFVEKEGFRVFVQTRFPSIETPPLWKDATQILTARSKAWDRKAFIARELMLFDRETNKPHRRRSEHRQNGQTMGYVPVIDSYETFNGNSWSDSKEVLAWGAGADIIMRFKIPKSGDDRSEVGSRTERPSEWDGREVDWRTFRPQGLSDGIDDITSISLLRPHQRADHEDDERLIVGRAKGQLDQMWFQHEPGAMKHVASYWTASKPIRSAHLSHEDRPLLAAAASDLGVLIYDTHDAEGMIMPSAGIDIHETGEKKRTWTTRFLSHDQLAIGLGPTRDPIHVYQVTPSSMSKDPLRKFSAAPTDAFAGSSVYTIVPLSSSSKAGGSPGDLFLSGWYNSHIKLHDLRSPSPFVAEFHDTVDTSPVYSLLAIGHERFLAGAGRDAIVKIFDLRLPGGRNYSYQFLNTLSNPCSDSNSNLFVRAAQCGSSRHSPTYALNQPSSTSSTIYVGLESTVVSLDLATTEEITRQPRIRHNFLNGTPHTRPLAGYERPVSSMGAVTLLAQEDIRRYLEPTGNFGARYAKKSMWNECVKGWDCRWRPTGQDREGAEGGRARPTRSDRRNGGVWR